MGPCALKEILDTKEDQFEEYGFLPSSRVWKSMKKGEVIFSKGTRWSLGRDNKLNFWIDSWTSNGPLRSIIHGPLTRGEADLTIGDIALGEGWEWEEISLTLPMKIRMEIQVMPQARIANKEDCLIWATSSNGKFNLNSAYLLVCDQEDHPISFNGK